MNTKNNPPYYENPDEESAIDVKRYLSLFISNWYWYVISLFIALCIAYGINRYSEKVYTVSATLLIKDDQNGALTEIFQGSEGFRSQQKVNNEIGILKSFNLNSRVIKELPDFCITYTLVGKRGIAETRMYKTAPFVVNFDTLHRQRQGERVNIYLLNKDTYRLEINGDKNFKKELHFGERFVEMGYNFTIDLRDKSDFRFDPEISNRYFFYFSDPASVANSYRSKLGVYPIETDASLVTLTITGFVPQQEADYLNTLMKVYLEFGLEYKNQTAAQSLNFIEEQLDVVSDSLRLAEKDLENFRLANSLIDLSREGSLIQNRLEEIDADKARLLLQKIYYQYLGDYIRTKDNNEEVISPSVLGLEDQFLIRLLQEYSELQKQKKQLSINLSESAQPLKIINSNIEDIRISIAGNIKDGLANINSSIVNANERLSIIEKEVKRLPSTERQMINIQRKFDINNTVYTFLLEKRAEAGIAKASNVPDNRIIDEAGTYSSARIKPKTRKNLMMAILLGLISPAVAIVMIDYLNNKIIDKKDIEKVTSAPILGFISHNSLKTELPVIESPGSTLSESFRAVRTNLKYFFKEKKYQVISITSTITGEGKTFISANLATILALSGKKVLLIGLDLRKPRIHKIFGIDNSIGISNYLIGEQKIEDIIIRTRVDNLWYTPSGPVPPNPAELIESGSMKSFIERAGSDFDYIIIDTPPVAIVTDALLVESFTDFYLFVVRQRYTSKNTLGLIEEFKKTGIISNVGILVNDINISGYYGYGLRYGYAMGMGYNYGYNYYESYKKYGSDSSYKSYYRES